MQEAYALHLENSTPYPLWACAAETSLIGILAISPPDSDFTDDNPLPYGHSAFIAEDTVLWVCRLWQAGQAVGHAVLQWQADLQQLLAVHDWSMPGASAQSEAAVLRSLLASAPQGLRFIGMSATQQAVIARQLAPAFFDPHNNATLHWSEHARTS